MREPLIPAALSLLAPGAGQLLNGDYAKAAVVFGVTAASYLIPVLGPPIRLVAWVYGVWDAYKTCQSRQKS